MVERLIVAAAVAASLSLVDEGKATRYDPGVMDVVNPVWGVAVYVQGEAE